MQAKWSNTLVFLRSGKARESERLSLALRKEAREGCGLHWPSTR
jgi:hypothetical protein